MTTTPIASTKLIRDCTTREKIKQIVTEEERIEATARDYLSRPTEVRDRTLILAGTNADRQAISKAVC